MYALGLIILLSSCDDYLDVKPKGVTLPDNAKSFDLLLSSTDLGRSESVSYRMTDDIDIPANWPDPWTYNAQPRLYDFVAEYWELGGTISDYTTMWTNIDKCNMVLENIDGASGSEADKIRIKANARCHRAYAYWEIMKLFCPQYTPATADKEDTGMPILTKVGFTASLKRGTLQELYDFIITELSESLESLSDLPEKSIYWSKSSVYGTLAKVYLQMGKYELARTNAAKCLGYYDLLLDYKENYLNKVDWQTNFYKPLIDHKELILIKGSYCSGYSPYWVEGINTLMSKDLVDKFTDKVNDIRASSFIILDPTYNAYYYAGVIGNKSISGITTPYMMLIQAECECRSDNGDYNEAMKLVNRIRKYRFKEGSDYTLTASDKNEALSHVMDEKRRELRFTESRFCDIKRLNALHNANISVTHTSIKTKEKVTLPANDNRWTLLIPQMHIDLNPEIVQNPRN